MLVLYTKLELENSSSELHFGLFFFSQQISEEKKLFSLLYTGHYKLKKNQPVLLFISFYKNFSFSLLLKLSRAILYKSLKK